MAAHKDLITKYAKQLNEANHRILELEVTVADVQSELEGLKAKGGLQRSNDTEGTTNLRDELAIKQHTIAELRNQLEQQYAAAQSSNTSNESARASELKEAELSRELQASKTAHVNEIKRWKLYVRPLEDQAAKAQEQSHRLEGLEAELHIKSQRVEELTEDLHASNAKNTRLSVQAAFAKAHRAEANKLREKLAECEEEAKGRETRVMAAKAKIKESNRRNLLQGAENARLKRGQEKAVSRAVDAARQEVAGLEDKLVRETKRKREAEATLGPDGKRCRKCHPVVVDLVTDDGQEGDGVASSSRPTGSVARKS